MVRKANKCIKKWLDNSALRWWTYGKGWADVCRSRGPEAKDEHQRGVLFVPPYFVYGEYEKVEVIWKSMACRRGEHETKIHVIWGCGGWGGTQVLAEIARGGWGLVEYKDYVASRPDASMPTDFVNMDWAGWFPWQNVRRRPSIPKGAEEETVKHNSVVY